jgi:hypothetical protein
MPEFLSTLAKHTAGTLSFNQLEAVSMLKTQYVHTKKHGNKKFGPTEDACRPIFLKQDLRSQNRTQN